MRKERFFRRIVAPPTLFLVVLLFIFSGCKKNDLGHQPPVHEKDFAERFFATTSTNPKVLEVINKLKVENERTGFVNKLPKDCGLPVWDKLVVSHHNKAMARGAGDSSEVMVIPLTLNNESLNSVIVVEENEQGYGIDCRTTNNYLYQIAHAPDVNVAQAENELRLFFYMEYKVFGTKKFHHIPPGLFSGSTRIDDDGNKTIEISNVPTDTSGLIWLEICTYKYHCTQSGDCEGGVCDECDLCITEDCKDIIIGGGGSGGHIPPGPTNTPPPPPGGGGGGSNTPPPTNPPPVPGEPCPDPLQGAWYGLLPPYNACGPPPQGPIPPDDEGPNPCDTFMTALKNDSSFALKFKSLTETSVLNLNYEKGLYINNRTGNSYLEVNGNPGSPYILLGGASVPMDGFLHVHTNALQQAPMFSTHDLLMMAEVFLKSLAKDSNNLFFGVAHGYGPPYIMKVTDAKKFRKFAEKIVNMEKSVKKKDQFSFKYANDFNSTSTIENEKGILEMMFKLGVGDGLSLYRAQNSNCKKWIKLERNNNNSTGVSEMPCSL